MQVLTTAWPVFLVLMVAALALIIGRLVVQFIGEALNTFVHAIWRRKTVLVEWTCGPALLFSISCLVASVGKFDFQSQTSAALSIGMFIVAAVLTGTFYAAFMGALCGECVDGEKMVETTDCFVDDL